MPSSSANAATSFPSTRSRFEPRSCRPEQTPLRVPSRPRRRRPPAAGRPTARREASLFSSSLPCSRGGEDGRRDLGRPLRRIAPRLYSASQGRDNAVPGSTERTLLSSAFSGRASNAARVRSLDLRLEPLRTSDACSNLRRGDNYRTMQNTHNTQLFRSEATTVASATPCSPASMRSAGCSIPPRPRWELLALDPLAAERSQTRTCQPGRLLRFEGRTVNVGDQR